VTAFDRLQAARAFAYGSMALCATLAILLGTDEAHSTAGTRLARMAVLTPFFGVVAVLAVVEHVRASGEHVALGALGLAPWRIAAGGVIAGWGFGVAGLVVLALPLADPAALFPAVPTAVDWHPDGPAALVSRGLGLRVASDGSLQFLEGAWTPGPATDDRWGAVVLAVPLVLAAPPWAAVTGSWAGRFAGMLSSGLATVVVVHLFAAGRLPLPALATPAAILLGHAAVLAVRPRQ
jgi:hypothetical protein